MRSTFDIVARLASSALLAASAGCGAGSSGGQSASPPALVTPAPPAAASPSSPFNLAQSPFGLQQQHPTQFVVLGYGFRATGGSFEDIPDNATYDGGMSLGFRLVTPSDLRLSIGALGEAVIVPNGGGGISAGAIVQLAFSSLGGNGSLSVLYDPSARPLVNTAFLYWSRVARGSTDPFPLDNVALVYGMATPVSAVPGAGIMRYVGSASGDTIEIDFATGRVTGRLQGEGNTFIDLVDATITADRSGVTGRVTGGAEQIDAPFEARFTGPTAGEIMYRFVHPVGVRKPAAVGALVRVG